MQIPPAINHNSLLEKRFSIEKIQEIEKQLDSVFDIKFAFNKWTLGEEFCKNLGFTDDQLKEVFKQFTLVNEKKMVLDLAEGGKSSKFIDILIEFLKENIVELEQAKTRLFAPQATTPVVAPATIGAGLTL